MIKPLIFIFLFLFIQDTNAQILRDSIRIKLIEAINNQLDVREVGGQNKGPMVEKYLKEVHAKPGDPWCGAFVGYNLSLFGIINPNSAWSPDYAKPEDIIWTPKKQTTKPLGGDVVTYYYPNLGRVGHTGFFENFDMDGYMINIEGNTNGVGSREGDGVYKKKRDPNKVNAVTRFIK